nr:hypothetical protein CFP56_38027 [Quercus suber]
MSSSNQNEASEQEIIPFNHGSPSQILRPSFEPQTDETVHHASNFVIIEGGGDAQAPVDVVEELEAEKNDDKLDDIPENMDCMQIPSPSSNGEEQNARKKKRRIQSGEDNMVKAIKEVTIILAAQLKDASDNLSKAVIGVVAAESRSKINDELLKLPSLTTKERYKATKLIACQHELIDVFLSMLDVEKEEWVKGLINGEEWLTKVTKVMNFPEEWLTKVGKFNLHLCFFFIPLEHGAPKNF